MNEMMIQEAVLDSIDQIDEESLFAEYNVLMGLSGIYTKSTLIAENSNCIFDGESVVYQEADEAEEGKENKASKLKGAMSKIIGTSEKGAESGIKGWFFKILRWIKKAFGLLVKKLKHLIRVAKNRKSGDLVQLNFKLDAVERVSEVIADASENLDTYFESKGDDKVAGKKLNTFISNAEKVLSNAKKPYKETIEKCDAAMNSIGANIDKAQKAYDVAFKKAEAFAKEIGQDAYNPKDQQKLQGDKTHAFNIDMKSLLARYAGVINRMTVVTADIAKALGIRKEEKKVEENIKMDWEQGQDQSGWD